ncbi:uncharacterized protein LOC121857536 [Homarus americanus]|uniref:uncharacterized protein LOC121857536 n=1 Tax=Homarus americanus TaxID=6706 RepID=UPI001C437FEA|nr:uncharacterized protein LOC121857536 [Homarus americanus]
MSTEIQTEGATGSRSQQMSTEIPTEGSTGSRSQQMSTEIQTVGATGSRSQQMSTEIQTVGATGSRSQQMSTEIPTVGAAEGRACIDGAIGGINAVTTTTQLVSNSTARTQLRRDSQGLYAIMGELEEERMLMLSQRREITEETRRDWERLQINRDTVFRALFCEDTTSTVAEQINQLKHLVNWIQRILVCKTPVVEKFRQSLEEVLNRCPSMMAHLTVEAPHEDLEHLSLRTHRLLNLKADRGEASSSLAGCDDWLDRSRIDAFFRQEYLERPQSSARPVSLARPVSPARPLSSPRPVSPARPVSLARPLSSPRPVSPARPLSSPRPVSLARPLSSPRPVSPARPVSVCRADLCHPHLSRWPDLCHRPGWPTSVITPDLSLPAGRPDLCHH